MPVYLDNAATANPKAPGVVEAMARSLGECNANPGHGAHRLAVNAALAVFAAREELASLLGVADCRRLVFTAGATASLNQAIWGSLPADAHAICTAWEHNAVLRPLAAWRRRGGQLTVLPAPAGRLPTVDDVRRALTPRTRLVVLTAASNVTGALLDIQGIGQMLRERGVRLLVDGAQVAGHLPLALDDLPLDLWAAAGHKGLLGPQGVGLLYVAPGIELEPLLVGGQGFHSEEEEAPEELPERLEAGTVNTPGILGLGAAATHLRQRGLAALRAHEVELMARLCEGLARIPALEIHTARRPDLGVGVVSVRIAGWPSSVAAQVLDQEFGVLTRAGLHCAPRAHQALGTAPQGTVRFSTGPFSTADDVDTALEAVAALAARSERAMERVSSGV